MKKTTKTEKSPAPAIKTTAPAPAPKFAAPASASKPAAAAPLTAAVRKTVKKAASPAPAAPAAAPASPAPSAPPRGASVTITAKIDVGFGNTLFLRGSGAGLNWNKGTPLVCIATDAWSLVLPSAKEPFAFKFLLNDATWSTGKDFLAGPGDTVTVTPVF